MVPLRRTAVIDVVALTPELLGTSTPRLQAWAARGRTATIRSMLPAVTCSVQATYLTGVYPEQHGVVGNGWYFRDECEIRFWRQSNRLVQAAKIWDVARQADPGFTCANLFWWFNMHSAVDYSVTPRPMYPADGRKIPDVYTRPSELRHELQSELGRFPLFEFWGPMTSTRSSRWIAEAAKRVESKHEPTLTLVYLPHLDYGLQRHGAHAPAAEEDLREIDSICAALIDFYEARGVQVMLLSEYGITDVSTPVHLNRVLRSDGLIAVREELGLELLDPGASAAFAVADHQVAHIYVNDAGDLSRVRELLEATPGVEEVLDEAGKRRHRLQHPRAGDLVAIAEPDAWFTYYYWQDDGRAPDFARTVDIHRKPGYDPAELFIDPALRLPLLKVGLTLLRGRLGFRTSMDVVPLDASLVRGSHGRMAATPAAAPMLLTQQEHLCEAATIDASDVHALILRHLGLPAARRPVDGSLER